jgi:alkylation response protein AidB-like acyl-CoA dehydrogenase
VDLNDDPQQAEFRAQVRGWLDAHKAEAPVVMGEGQIEDEHERIEQWREWQRKLADAGLCGVTWPEEFGGAGKGPIEQVIVNQELSRAQVPGALDFIGIGMMGPAIIAHGTDEQKRRYHGPMLHGDEV